MIITFEIEDAIAYALAISSGWAPMIEDTDQDPIEGSDNYPLVQNPVSAEEFVTSIVSTFLRDHVLREGRNRVITDFNSIKDSLEHKIKSGAFDDMIMRGDIDGIKSTVVQSLISDGN